MDVIIKGVNLTGFLGGHKRRLGVWGPQRVQGQSPSRVSGSRPPVGSRGGEGSGGQSPPEAEAFL